MWLWLPWLARHVFGVLAEGLVCYGAGGHGAWRRPCESGRRGLGNLLAEMTDPFLLLVLGQGQKQHVSGRCHIVIN